jgi:hypothetical protein
MASMSDYPNRLTFDVASDLERIDGAFTRLLSDRNQWQDFLKDPNGVLVKLGLHPPATPDANARANLVFYATLANKRLVQLAKEMFEDFQDPTDNASYYTEGLKKGLLQNRLQYDLAAVNHFLSKPDKARELYQLAISDLSAKGILTRRYSEAELNTYLDGLFQGMQEGLGIEELPTLERWDRHYGVGTGYGFGEVEVGPVATVPVLVEGVMFVTVLGFIPDNIPQLLEQAYLGDDEAVKSLSILSNLLALSSDLATHVQNFESRWIQ